MVIKCEHCGNEVEKHTGHVNRARKMGNKLYCNRLCSGLGRRDNKTIEQRKAEKSEYDKKYCKKNEKLRKKQRDEWFLKDYAANPEKYRERRKRKYKKHLEYLNTPEYKAWKQKYDVQYHAKKNYGEYYESHLLLKEIETHIDNRQIKRELGITNKSQIRNRLWRSLQRKILRLPSGGH